MGMELDLLRATSDEDFVSNQLFLSDLVLIFQVHLKNELTLMCCLIAITVPIREL